MNILLTSIDWTPLVYGLVMFIGVWVMFHKLMRGRWISLICDVAVFWLVFKLHGGTMSGGFAAMVASLLAGIVFPRYLRK